MRDGARPSPATPGAGARPCGPPGARPPPRWPGAGPGPPPGPVRRRPRRAGRAGRRPPASAARPGGPGGRGPGQGGRVGRVEGGGQVVEQGGVVAHQGGGAGQEPGHVALGHAVEQGEHLVAHPVAAVGRVGVARVLHGHQPGGGAHGPGVGPAQGQQRLGRARPDAGQAVEAGPPHQVQEHGLGHVVGGVAGHGAAARGRPGGRPGPAPPGSARAPRRPGRPRTRPRAGGGRGPHDVGLGRRAGPQAVVDVHGGDVEPGRGGQDEQGQRVGPAGHPRHHRGPGRREGAAVEQRASTGSGQAWAPAPDPDEPALRVLDLDQRREHLGAGPDPVDQLPAAGRLDGVDEPLALLVLVHLGLEADELLHDLGRPRDRLAPVAQDPAEALGRRDAVGPGPVHGDVAVALEQAHHPADAPEHLLLLGGGQQGHQPALVERVAPGPHLVGGPPEGLHEALGVGLDAAEAGVDQGQEVRPQPRHAGELEAVGHLVEGQPQAELAGREGEALLEAEDVRAHVVDEVLVLGRVVLHHQQVVLAEHPGRHPAEERPDLGAGHRSGDLAGQRRCPTPVRPAGR